MEYLLKRLHDLDEERARAQRSNKEVQAHIIRVRALYGLEQEPWELGALDALQWFRQGFIFLRYPRQVARKYSAWVEVRGFEAIQRKKLNQSLSY